MITRYLEPRGRVHGAPANVAQDIMRHFHARQHLGSAVVFCQNPAEMLLLAQRQWLRLSRTLQRQRGAATDAVEILKYTYTITQMQHVQFSNNHRTPSPKPIFTSGWRAIGKACRRIA